MSRQWWNDSDDRLESMHKLFDKVSKLDDIENAAKLVWAEQLEGILAEQERRKRARAIPPIPFGRKVEVIELLPDSAACATPPIGMTGKSLGQQFEGATAVQFSRAELYPRDDDEYDDPYCVLYMPNYSIAEKS